MSDAQAYLAEYDSNKSEASLIAVQTAQKLASGQLTLVALIESLGEYFNHDDGGIRTKTMAYLAEVLAALSSGKLSLQQRNLLSDFIVSRIESDAQSLGHSASALLALEKLGRLDEQRVQNIVTALLQHASPLVKVKAQSERFTILTLVDTLISNYRTAWKHLHEGSKDFIARLIAFFDGEKDPRNLMIVFSVLNAVMTEWDVSADASDLFEAVFNYFPITFRPPPGDPYGITAQQLKDRLRDCISSTAFFAPYAFPALLDKLDSTSANVKRDAIQAIAACASYYEYATMDLYSVTLWDALKFEVLNAQDDDLAEEALTALVQIGRTLSSSVHEGPVQTFVKPIVKESNEHLEDTPTKQSSATGRILSAVSSASPEASNLVCRGVIPQIITLYKSSESLSKRRGLLEVLNKLIKANIALFGRWRGGLIALFTPIPNPRAFGNNFTEFSDPALEMFHSALVALAQNEVSFRLLGLEGLRNLAIGRQLLADVTISRIIRTLDEIVIRETPYGKDEVKSGAIDGLVEIAHDKPQLIIESAMPEFMAELPDNDQDSQSPYVPILEAFAKLSGEPQIFSTLVLRLKNKFHAALRSGASTQYAESILSALLFAFSHGGVNLEDAATFGKYYSEIALPLVKEAASEPSGSMGDDAVLDLIGRIGNLIIRPQPWVAQTEICRNIYTLFRTENVAEVAPFKAGVAEQSTNSMLMSTHLLAALQRQAVPHPDMDELLRALVAFATVDTISASVRAATVHQISLIVNKYFRSSDKLPSAILQFGSDTMLDPSRLSANNLRVAFAILKALVLRIDPNLPQIMPSFLALLAEQDIGKPTARAIASLLSPSDLLTKENHCSVNSLHKQRFFALTVPSIATSFPKANALTKQNYLIALSGIVNGIPYHILREELPRLVPLLLQSLSLDDAHVKANTIETFSRVVIEDPKLVEEHVESLVTRLLEVATGSVSKVVAATKGISTNPYSSRPATRAAALACLAAFVRSFRVELLVPHKQMVVRRLASSLDDPKRAVRAEAVKCRAEWTGLGKADEDDED